MIQIDKKDQYDSSNEPVFERDKITLDASVIEAALFLTTFMPEQAIRMVRVTEAGEVPVTHGEPVQEGTYKAVAARWVCYEQMVLDNFAIEAYHLTQGKDISATLTNFVVILRTMYEESEPKYRQAA